MTYLLRMQYKLAKKERRPILPNMDRESKFYNGSFEIIPQTKGIKKQFCFSCAIV